MREGSAEHGVFRGTRSYSTDIQQAAKSFHDTGVLDYLYAGHTKHVPGTRRSLHRSMTHQSSKRSYPSSPGTDGRYGVAHAMHPGREYVTDAHNQRQSLNMRKDLGIRRCI